MRSLDHIIESLPAERRARVVARGERLVAEEMALHHLREARDLTQKNMAELLGIDQAGVSKIEHRSDLLLSTLRSYVEAMDGSLHLIAKFPDGAIELATIGEVAENPKSPGPRPKPVTPRA